MIGKRSSSLIFVYIKVMINFIIENNQVKILYLDKDNNIKFPIRHRKTIPFTYEEMYEAYESCNKNKKNDVSAVNFEKGHLYKLYKLLKEVNSFNYHTSSATCFIIYEPTIREVFASQYRDRIIHHLLINEIGDILENIFIHNTYSCRVGKGNTKAVDNVIKHVNKLKAKGDVFYLKIDLSGYFMSINRKLLTSMICSVVDYFYKGYHYDYVIYLINIIINSDITQNCTFKSPKEAWNDLPDRKTLFKSGNNGIPIGDLTSQWFSNLYAYILDTLYRSDKYKNKIYYDRYVDDIVVTSNDSDLLKEFLKDFKETAKQLNLKINNKKTLIRPITYGIHFLGKVIYRDYTTLSKRNINRMYKSLYTMKGKNILSVLNSRVGDIKRYNCYNLIQDFAKKAIKIYPFLEFNYPKFQLKEGCELPEIYK